MASTKEEIIDDIKSYIIKREGGYSKWYVGIAEDAQKRLFEDHGVREEGNPWIYRTANSSSIAREVEEYFVNVMGTDGGLGGGGEDTKMVYAYKKQIYTDP